MDKQRLLQTYISGQSLLCSATKTIQVVEDTTVAGDSATVYYLLDPTKDANSNDSGNWGQPYGTAKVNVTGATWTGGKNCLIMLIKEL